MMPRSPLFGLRTFRRLSGRPNPLIVKRVVKAYSKAVYQFNTDKKLGITTYSKWLPEQPKHFVMNWALNRPKTLNPRSGRGQVVNRRTGVQMIAQRPRRAITDAAVEQHFEKV